MTNMQSKVIDFAAAVALMHKLCETKTLDVAVFYDKGASKQPSDISIIADGDGQKPLAFISEETYSRLQKAAVIGTNNLITFKTRRNHPYLGHGNLEECLPRMQSVARYFPKLSDVEKTAVLRTLYDYVKNGAPTDWPTDKDNYHIATLADVGLVLKFGWSMNGGRFLSSIRRQRQLLAA